VVDFPPGRLGKQGHEIELYAFGILGGTQAKPGAETLDMRVHSDTFVQAETVGEHDIGRLSGHPGQGEQLLHAGRYLGGIVVDQLFGGLNQVLGLVPVQSSRADNCFYLGLFGICQVAHCGPPGKEGGSDGVYPDIGALGGQDCGHQ